MRKIKSIKISEDAYFDIEEMFSYISSDNKNSARELGQKIYDGIKGLKDFPNKYPAVQEEFYRVVDDTVIIARVLHFRQNWLHVLFGFSGICRLGLA